MAVVEAKRILVVDDASLVRRYYRQILEKAGYTVDEALNGIEAMEKLLENAPDLLIVDVNMPQMDGLTFIAALRRQPLPQSAIPALVTTTESKPEDRISARKAGANFFLTKPVGEKALIDHVALLCGGPT
jgi:two-component system chemotaxis response regulator CheY